MKRYEPGSLDLALEYLRAHRLPYRWSEQDVRTWEAVCPSCRAGEWGLRLREPVRGGPISLLCKSGCEAQAIREALEHEPVEPRVEAAELRAANALDLAERCREVAARALELDGRTII